MSALQTLIDMFASGGLEVTTFARGINDNEEGPLLYRTVVQPDANIITWVNPKISDSQAWQEHQKKLDSHIQAIRDIRKQLTSLWAILSLILVAITLFVPTPQELLYGILKLAVTAGGIYALRLLLKLALRWYIRRQLRKYIPGW